MWNLKTQDKGKAPAQSDRKDILAQSYHEDILAQSKRQMQRIESHTEYMSRCIRGWVKDFLEQGILPSHQQGKHAKRALLLDDEDIKLAARTWLHSISPKDRSPLKLKKKLKTNIFSKLLGVPITILEKTTQKFMHLWGLFRWSRMRKRERISEEMEQFDDDDMENVIPPERLEIWDMRHVLVTYDEVYFYANDNNSSFWVENEESIIKKKGQGSAIMADDTRLGLDRGARVIIKPGQQADGYWKSEDM
ncbi:12344_t:CDS:2, partial [Gigaspora rosea]